MQVLASASTAARRPAASRGARFQPQRVGWEPGPPFLSLPRSLFVEKVPTVADRTFILLERAFQDFVHARERSGCRLNSVTPI